MRGVEAEQPGFDLLDAEPADRAGEFGRKYRSFLGVGVLGVDDAVRHAQRGFKTVGEAGADALANHQSVHHGLNLMLGLTVQGRDFGDFIQFAVHLDPGEAAALQFRQFLAVFAFPVAHDRGEQQQASAFRHGGYPVHHLADGLRFDRQPGGGGIGDADARP